MDKSVTSTEFKASCIHLMDEVAATRIPLLITKRGRPVAVLAPAAKKKSRCEPDPELCNIVIHDDLTAPTTDEWLDV